ncbi:hypothetical protein LDENG_00148630, partial [Lucifuga dentata]
QQEQKGCRVREHHNWDEARVRAPQEEGRGNHGYTLWILAGLLKRKKEERVFEEQQETSSTRTSSNPNTEIGDVLKRVARTACVAGST